MESIDKILAEEGYVRRLARALLTDSNDVDDIVQEVWVEALERPPRSQGSRRPWLRTVVRSLTLDRRRSDAARHRRETAAASLMTGSVPSVVEVQIQESIRCQMIEELLVLPEKYRAVLILQYMRGLEPHQIAARLRLPDSTVRTRSARGRELLRRRMDARHDGDRRAWTLILAPYAGLSPAPVAALGEVLTGARLWLAVAGVIVIAAAVTLVVNSNPPGDLTGADQVSDRFAIESPLPSEPLRREVVLDGVGRSIGHIALAGGKPASGLRYWVDWGVELPPHAREVDYHSNPDRRARAKLTGADGGWEWSWQSEDEEIGLLFCEVGPSTLVGFEIDRAAPPRTLRLPELADIVCRFAGEPKAGFKVGLHPGWLTNGANPAVEHQRYWTADAATNLGVAKKVLLFPPQPDQVDWACCFLRQQFCEIESGAELRFTTIRGARFSVWATAPGHLVRPKESDRKCVRAPALVTCSSVGPGPRGEIRLLDRAGNDSAMSGRFELMRGSNIDTGHPMFHRSETARIEAGRADLMNTRVGHHGRLGPYQLFVITEAGELFERSIEFSLQRPTIVPLRQGSGRQGIRIRTVDSVLGFSDLYRVVLFDQGSTKSWIVPSFKPQKPPMNLRGVSRDGRELFLFQDRPWVMAWILTRSGHLGIAERKFGDEVIVCRWVPSRPVGPLDLRSIMERHGTGSDVTFELQILVPVAPNRFGRWITSSTYQLKPRFVTIGRPVWKLVVPEGIEYRIRIRLGSGFNAPSILLDY